MSGFRLLRRARADLLDIADFTAGRWGDQQAEAYLRALFDAFRRLAEEPQRRRRYPDLPRSAGHWTSSWCVSSTQRCSPSFTCRGENRATCSGVEARPLGQRRDGALRASCSWIQASASAWVAKFAHGHFLVVTLSKATIAARIRADGTTRASQTVTRLRTSRWRTRRSDVVFRTSAGPSTGLYRVKSMRYAMRG
ncbi:MAG: type II toxin-antitoxin system RelE/ParE family toxin [Myxococcales bacterium]|nr:type II toxin-antitoxin system RelE/ParE family toxin [Myxococcales bacterium]